MLSIDESAELRTLHGRAYGRGSGLTAAELERLRTLEALKAPVPSSPDAVPPRIAESSSGSAPEAGPTRRALRAESSPSDAPAADISSSDLDIFDDLEASAGASEAPAAPRPFLRRWYVIGAIALVLGFGAGWLAFGWDSQSFVLNLAHADQRAELEASGDYDPGTVVAVGEQHGAVAWRATSSEGAEECAILTTAEQTASDCQPHETVAQGVLVGTALALPGEDGEQNTLWFSMVQSSGGESTPFFQLSPQNYDWTSQFTEEELVIARELEAEGFDVDTLSILGYDGDAPVWSAWTEEGLCIIVDTGDGRAQACDANGTDMVLSTTVHGTPTDYLVEQTNMRGPQLTIVKLPEAFFIEQGDEIELDDKTGASEG